MSAFSGLKDYFEKVGRFTKQHGYVLISPVTGRKFWINNYDHIEFEEIMMKKIFDKLKLWFSVAFNYIKKNWKPIINFLIIIIAYGSVYNIESLALVEFLLGFWIFVLIAHKGYLWFISKK